MHSYSSFSAGSPGEHTPDDLARMKLMQQMWAGPPPNRVPVAWPFTAVLGRSDDAAIAVVGGQLYPEGLVFRLVALLRRTGTGSWPGALGGPATRGPHGGPDPQGRRFGVRFLDGRSTEVLGEGIPDLGSELDPSRPRMLGLGGGGDGRRWEEDLFLTPLPADGPLELFCQWPRYGIRESRATVDMSGAVAAASRSVELWPYEPEPDLPFRPPRLGDPGDGFFRPILEDDAEST